MEIETLKRSNLKRNIMIGVVVVAIIIVCAITLTRAKYRTVASTTLIKGEVNYTLADLNIVAITLDGGDVDTLPDDGYYNLLSTSYCEVDDTRIDTLSWDGDTQTLTIEPFTTRGTKCYLDFETSTTLRDTILADNGTPKTNPTLTATSCEEGSNKNSSGTEYNNGDCGIEENGLYQETVYEGTSDEGTTYYFRGTVDYNWVSFAGFYWRIIRINEDGTVRLIYSGEVNEDNDGVQESNITGTGTQLDEISAFNEQSGASYYVGYMYTESDDEEYGQHGTDKDSTIKIALDAWYETYIYGTDEEKYIADSGFCGDREVANGYSWESSGTTFNYAAYSRRTGTPTFECNNEEDLYTTSTSDKGNRALKYAIGLITMDEVRYAGAYSNITNYGYWLYTERYYWTMTPSFFNSRNNPYVFAVSSVGGLDGSSHVISGSVYNSIGVRPVINLSADVTISGGNGEADNPYIVSV